MNAIVDSLKVKQILKDRIVLCFSLRSNEYNMDIDLNKTKMIINALEINGFYKKTSNDGIWAIEGNKGIRAYNNTYIYPQEALDYIEELNKKCYKYIEDNEDCNKDCEKYLNRKPILKTENIRFQIIELERN